MCLKSWLLLSSFSHSRLKAGSELEYHPLLTALHLMALTFPNLNPCLTMIRKHELHSVWN